MLEIQRPTHDTKPATVTPLAFKARSAVGKDFFFFFLDFQVRCVWREMGNTNCPVFSEVPMGSWDSPYRTDPRVDSRFQGKLLTSTARDPDLTRALSWMRASVAKQRNGEGSQEVS